MGFTFYRSDIDTPFRGTSLWWPYHNKSISDNIVQGSSANGLKVLRQAEWCVAMIPPLPHNRLLLNEHRLRHSITATAALRYLMTPCCGDNTSGPRVPFRCAWTIPLSCFAFRVGTVMCGTSSSTRVLQSQTAMHKMFRWKRPSHFTRICHANFGK